MAIETTEDARPEDIDETMKRHAVEIAETTTTRLPGKGGAGNWQPSIEWVSAQEAHKQMGPSTKSFYNWRQDGCPGVRDDGSVNIGMVTKWLIDRAYQSGMENSAKSVRLAFGQKDYSLDELEIAEKLVDIQIKDLKFKAANGELVPKSFIRDVLNVQVGEVASRLRGAGAKVAPLVAGEKDVKTCQNIVDREIDDAFGRISTDDGTGNPVIDAEKILKPDEIIDPATQNGTVELAPHRKFKGKPKVEAVEEKPKRTVKKLPPRGPRKPARKAPARKKT